MMNCHKKRVFLWQNSDLGVLTVLTKLYELCRLNGNKILEPKKDMDDVPNIF